MMSRVRRFDPIIAQDDVFDQYLEFLETYYNENNMNDELPSKEVCEDILLKIHSLEECSRLVWYNEDSSKIIGVSRIQWASDSHPNYDKVSDHSLLSMAIIPSVEDNPSDLIEETKLELDRVKKDEVHIFKFNLVGPSFTEERDVSLITKIDRNSISVHFLRQLNVY